jgi:class 3 adenylate cyclase
MMDFRPRPDFTQAHEIQQEQIAMLISQQIEAWALRRDMERLERERRRLEAPLLKASPPDRYAALVFTDIQGSTSLWEANADAMNEALSLHDQIMRKCIANHHGYEVTTEGDAFHIAFHEAIDAVGFALEAQMALHHARWSDDILALPEACNDGNAFRGLRVRMAIHAGDVTIRDNEVSGRREFAGPTFYVGKS